MGETYHKPIFYYTTEEEHHLVKVS